MAGVSEILSNESNLLGHESIVVQKSDLDPFGFGEYYGNQVTVQGMDKFVELLFEGSRNADVVIVHDWIEFLDEIECPNVYVYFHGSKLRSMPNNEIQYIRDKVNGIILSTPDLLEKCPDGRVLPQPIDLDLFYDYEHDRQFNQLSIQNAYQFPIIEPLIKELYPKCNITIRNNSIPIYYQKMPEMLNRWKEYVDCKIDYAHPPNKIYVPSMTGLQAIACGCDVWNWKKEKLEKSLLRKHDSKKVVKEFLNYIAN